MNNLQKICIKSRECWCAISWCFIASTHKLYIKYGKQVCPWNIKIIISIQYQTHCCKDNSSYDHLGDLEHLILGLWIGCTSKITIYCEYCDLNWNIFKGGFNDFPSYLLTLGLILKQKNWWIRSIWSWTDAIQTVDT